MLIRFRKALSNFVRKILLNKSVTDQFLTVKSKVYLVQKTLSFLRSSIDSLDSNAKVIDGLCEDPIAAQTRKKIAW